MEEMCNENEMRMNISINEDTASLATGVHGVSVYSAGCLEKILLGI